MVHGSIRVFFLFFFFFSFFYKIVRISPTHILQVKRFCVDLNNPSGALSFFLAEKSRS